MAYVLIDEAGKIWPGDASQPIQSIRREMPGADPISAAIRFFGLTYTEWIGRSLLVVFRPETMTVAAMAGLFSIIARGAPDRVALSFGVGNNPPEIHADRDAAMKRIEQLGSALRLPAYQTGIVAKRRSLDRLSTFAKDRPGALLRAWTAPPAELHEIRRLLRSIGLLSDAFIVRTPPRDDAFIIEHWGANKGLFGRRWAREARGRDIRDQPYPKLTEWVLATLREGIDTRTPRLDEVHATAITSRGTIQRRHYHRLLVPLGSGQQDTLTVVVNFFSERWPVE